MFNIKAKLLVAPFLTAFARFHLSVSGSINRASRPCRRVIALVSLSILTTFSSACADKEVVEDGERRCIQIRSLTSTDVIDDRNAIFYMVGAPIYHNVLPEVCPGLSDGGAFTHEVFAGSLCSGDQIRLLSRFGDLTGRTCKLGYFNRVTKEDVEALFEASTTGPSSNPLPSSDVEDVSPESD